MERHLTYVHVALSNTHSVHYDAIAGAAGAASAPESMDLRQFPAGDEESKAKALALVAELKKVSLRSSGI